MARLAQRLHQQRVRPLPAVVLPRDTKLERLHRVVIEASKQCGRNVLMQIHELTDWRDFHQRTDLPALRIMAHPAGPEPLPDDLGSRDACFAVGPEGGFTPAEVTAARDGGWLCVTLGPRVLRVETAAIALAVACGLAKR